MLDYIERHKIGILTTIIIHLFLLVLFMAIQFGSLKAKKQKQEVLIDFVDPQIMEKAIDQKKEEIKKTAQQELMKDLKNQEQVGRNIAVNQADADAKKSIDEMVKDIKGELNIHDQKANDAINPQPKAEDLKKKEPEVTSRKKDYVENSRGERTFYKGPTTITYYLEGRMHVYIPVPVYQCQGGGKVVMDIQVNKSGYVVSANVNKSESRYSEACIAEAATRAALTTRFNSVSSGSDKQQGRISYIFIAQ